MRLNNFLASYKLYKILTANCVQDMLHDGSELIILAFDILALAPDLIQIMKSLKFSSPAIYTSIGNRI